MYSKLEKLWGGRKVLTNLKKLNLTASWKLKELPDLSNVTNLKVLSLLCCESLVEIPSSCSHLHKLQKLLMKSCISLEVIPADMNLASLRQVSMTGCSRLRNVPVMSTNITNMYISDTAVQDVSPSIRLCSRLEFLYITRSGNFKGLTHLPTSVRTLDLSYTGIRRILDCIKDLHRLETLNLCGCIRLASLPKLPNSLKVLKAEECESLETVASPLATPSSIINFTNCFKLCQEARETIIQPSFRNGSALLPGKEVPAEFDHRAKGNLLTIPPDVNRSYSRLLVCVVISHNHQITEEYDFFDLMRPPPIDRWDFDPVVVEGVVFRCRKEHVFIFDSRFPDSSDVSRDMVFEFSSKLHGFEIIECGAKILTDQSMEGSYEFRSDHVYEDEIMEGSYESGSDHVYEDEIMEGSYESGSDHMFEKESISWSYGSGPDQVSEEESIAWSYGSGSDHMSEEDIVFEPSEESYVEERNIDDLSNGVTCDSKEVENLQGKKTHRLLELALPLLRSLSVYLDILIRLYCPLF